MAESDLLADLRVAAMFEDASTAELLKKAADEIERLQNQVKGMRFIIEAPRGEDLANIMTGDE